MRTDDDVRTDDDLTQTARDRRLVVAEAGYPTMSFPSVLAGTLTGYGAFAIIAALFAALLDAADIDTDFSTNDWTSTGAVGGLATGLALLVAYLFGGYVAGRMARRAGLLHGIGVAVLSIVGGGLAGAVISALADQQAIEDNLASIGVPTTWDDWSAVAVTTAIIAVAAVVVGSILGALYGERWHSRLLVRAADPERGRSAEIRRRADEAEAERDRLVRTEARPMAAADGEWVATDPDRDGNRDRDLDRERVAEPSLAERVRDSQTDDREIDLRDDRDEVRPPAYDEPRYTAAEWQAMQRTELRHGDR